MERTFVKAADTTLDGPWVIAIKPSEEGAWQLEAHLYPNEGSANNAAADFVTSGGAHEAQVLAPSGDRYKAV